MTEGCAARPPLIWTGRLNRCIHGVVCKCWDCFGVPYFRFLSVKVRCPITTEFFIVAHQPDVWLLPFFFLSPTFLIFRFSDTQDLSDVRVGIFPEWFNDAAPLIKERSDEVVAFLKSRGATVVPIQVSVVCINTCAWWFYYMCKYTTGLCSSWHRIRTHSNVYVSSLTLFPFPYTIPRFPTCNWWAWRTRWKSARSSHWVGTLISTNILTGIDIGVFPDSRAGFGLYLCVSIVNEWLRVFVVALFWLRVILYVIS